MGKKSVLYSSFIFTSAFTFLIFFLAIFAHADTLGSTKVSYSTGKKSQTSGIEERDLDGYFRFNKYSISVKAEPKEKFHYKAGYQYYIKIFDPKRTDLNAVTDTGNLYFSMPLYSQGETLIKLDADYRLRAKRYKNSPSNEYDNNNINVGIDIKPKKDYSVKFSGGIKDYDYIKDHNSDKLKTFFKIAPKVKILERKLSLSGYYRRDMVEQTDNKKDYSENCLSIRTAYDIGKPILDKISGHFGYGRNDTRDDNEDREDDLRFEYQLWDVTVHSRPFKNIEGGITYGQKHRKYFTSIDGYDNWYINKNTKIRLLKKDSFSVDMLLDVAHKETKFFKNEDLSYNKNSLNAGFSMVKRSDFSIKPSFKYTRYKYPPFSTQNQKTYVLKLDTKKYIGSTDKALEAAYLYEWKNYEYSADSNRWNLNLSFVIKF
jgi:hypothetical protein